MREHAEVLDHAVLENGPEDRAGQAGDDQDRRHLADQDVLGHVDEEELLLADRIDRGEQCDRKRRETERKASLAPDGDRRPLAPERRDPPVVGDRGDDERDRRQRVERPARERREVLGTAEMREHHRASLDSDLGTTLAV